MINYGLLVFLGLGYKDIIQGLLTLIFGVDRIKTDNSDTMISLSKFYHFGPDFQTLPNMLREKRFKIIPPPYKIKAIEPIKTISKKEREKAIKKAGFNTFLLPSERVYIDLLTDSGTSAMSDNQWAGIMLGDEAYAGSKNFYNLEQAVKDVYGYKYVIPVHQGRGGEHIISKLLIKKGDYIPSNMYFTTSRQHAELMGGIWVDVSIDEAHDPESWHKFKGNVDFKKIKNLLKEVGREKIAFVRIEACLNMAGGQPFSMRNLKALREFTLENNIFLFLDATRAVGNAHFIKKRERGYKNKSVQEILKEICSFTDGCVMSSKKDNMVNIGGFVAVNSKSIYEEAINLDVVYEGLHTYGGMSGRDMEALARGVREAVATDDHISARVNQIEYLGYRLIMAKVPIVVPIGEHAVFLDAKRFLPRMPQEHFPAQALAAYLYIESGIRSMERGVVSAGRDPDTGDHRYPKLELVRLTVPRRVYTREHIDFVADAVVNLYKKRSQIKGLKMIFEPKKLRFFQAKFKPI